VTRPYTPAKLAELLAALRRQGVPVFGVELEPGRARILLSDVAKPAAQGQAAPKEWPSGD
jgi:hypothetical protein